jgi:hypothetical protein
LPEPVASRDARHAAGARMSYRWVPATGAKRLADGPRLELGSRSGARMAALDADTRRGTQQRDVRTAAHLGWARSIGR